MNNLFTLLGEAKANLELAHLHSVSSRTAEGYIRVYGRWRAGLVDFDSTPPCSRAYVRSAIRYGLLGRLREATAQLDALLGSGSSGRDLTTIAAEVRQQLDLLRRYPLGRPGKRSGARKATTRSNATGANTPRAIQDP